MKDAQVDVGLEILSARLDANLTQEKLAKRMHTKQPSLARVERGASIPTISFLQRVAKATKSRLLIAFIPIDKRLYCHNTSTSYTSIYYKL